jgi:hypothetical protein
MDGAGQQETGLQQQQDAMVWQVLVQEAQQEIGNLRAELYSTRRLAEERRQAHPGSLAACCCCQAQHNSSSIALLLTVLQPLHG